LLKLLPFLGSLAALLNLFVFIFYTRATVVFFFYD
jgi:hypothetical protein